MGEEMETIYFIPRDWIRANGEIVIEGDPRRGMVLLNVAVEKDTHWWVPTTGC